MRWVAPLEKKLRSDLLTAFHKAVQKSPAATTVPEQKPAQTPAAASTLKASSTDNIRPQTTPAMTRAIIFRPGRDEKQWSRTGLSQEYHPTMTVANTADHSALLLNMSPREILIQ